MAAPIVNEAHFEKLWEHFDKKNDLIPNLYSQLCDDQKLRMFI